PPLLLSVLHLLWHHHGGYSLPVSGVPSGVSPAGLPSLGVAAGSEGGVSGRTSGFQEEACCGDISGGRIGVAGRIAGRGKSPGVCATPPPAAGACCGRSPRSRRRSPPRSRSP